MMVLFVYWDGKDTKASILESLPKCSSVAITTLERSSPMIDGGCCLSNLTHKESISKIQSRDIHSYGNGAKVERLVMYRNDGRRDETSQK